MNDDARIPNDECNAFQNCIKSYIQKRKKRFLKKRKLSSSLSSSTSNSDELLSLLPPSFHKYTQQAIHLTNHGIYILKNLTVKRQSLSLAIDAFYIISKECISCISAYNGNSSNMNRNMKMNSKRKRQSSSSLRDIVQIILTHIFTQYIHIRDGFVLLTSGECRHTADANTAKHGTNNTRSSTPRYPSRLSQLQERGDGYTKKYSSNCGYSGYAWDEFFDEEVGVKRRLLDVLLKLSSSTSGGSSNDDHEELDTHAKQQKRNDLWETSLGDATEIFENAFDTHANAMKELQRKLENYRMKILHELQNVLNSSASSSSPTARSSLSTATHYNITITMVTEDKFERLELKNAKRLLELESFSIQREGDTFKGNDRRGALPSNMSIQDWKEIMKLPLVLHQIIHGNHDDDKKNRDSTWNNKKSVSSSSSITNNKPQPSKRKKNKLVICDSSDDEDDEDNDDVNERSEDPTSTTIQNTLKVTFKAVPQNDSSNTNLNDYDNNNDESTPIRIHDIKKQHGVNADELQRSREELEEEEMISKKAAFMDEIGCDDQDDNNNNNDDDDDDVQDDSGKDESSNQSFNQHTRQQHPNPSRVYNGDIELDTSSLRTNRNGPTALHLERNDVLHNESSTSNHYLLEPTERIIIGAKKQQRNQSTSSSSRKNSDVIDANKDFEKFGMRLEDGDDEACFEDDGEEDEDRRSNFVQKYRRWGDEVLQDLGIDVNKYPGCAPERPPEMIKELGL